MELKMEIICKDFKHKKSIENKLRVQEIEEEYYIIPITRPLDMETDGEVYKLTFTNQLLWLKYSTHQKTILVNEYDYEEFILIKSKDIIDIYINLHTNRCFRKNVWHSDNKVHLNKKYLDKYFLVLSVFEDAIDVKEFGEDLKYYQIHMNTNEVLLKKATPRAKSSGCNLIITNNMMLNKEALFVPLSDESLELFLP